MVTRRDQPARLYTPPNIRDFPFPVEQTMLMHQNKRHGNLILVPFVGGPLDGKKRWIPSNATRVRAPVPKQLIEGVEVVDDSEFSFIDYLVAHLHSEDQGKYTIASAGSLGSAIEHVFDSYCDD